MSQFSEVSSAASVFFLDIPFSNAGSAARLLEALQRLADRAQAGELEEPGGPGVSGSDWVKSDFNIL